ncbi:MAG: NYN domain-containing protein [Chloroflexi bacterium]|nr:NYN domain-containing protein [Chloroflexota bacterium]MBI3763189.1 NYN domain-containing protein [Chloroflexota bacterium]
MVTIDWKRHGRALVLIDSANFSKGAETIGKRVNYRNLARYFRRETNLVQIVVYIADFGTPAHAAFMGALRHIGYQIVSKPVKTVLQSGGSPDQKANFDVEITLDAMDWISDYDTLVLFSGDSDFAALARRLRPKGKQVIVCAFRHTVSRELRAAADRYLNIPDLGGGIMDWGS